MTAHPVNLPSASPTPAPAGRHARGEGFKDLVSSDETTDDADKSNEEPRAAEAPIAALFSLPFLMTPAPATDAAAETVTTGGGADGETPALPDLTALIGSVKSQAAPQAAPALSMAAALAAQAEGLNDAGAASAHQASNSLEKALAASGVIKLTGETSGDPVKLGASAAPTAPGTGSDAAAQSIATTLQGTASHAGDKGDKSAAGKSTDAATVSGALAGAGVKAKADAEITGGEAAAAADAAQTADAQKSPAQPDRPQAPLQTSAAPATPSAAIGQAAATTVAPVAAAIQVANQIVGNASSRRTRFEVQLDPGDLGRVDVRLDIAHDGRVATRLIVERPETLDLLRNDARELSRTLEQAGFQLGQGGLAFQLKDNRQAFWAGEASASPAAGDEIDEPAPVAAAYRRTSSAGAGGVDRIV